MTEPTDPWAEADDGAAPVLPRTPNSHLPALPEGFEYEVQVRSREHRVWLTASWYGHPDDQIWRLHGDAAGQRVEEKFDSLPDALRLASRVVRAVAAADAALAAAAQARQAALADLLTAPEPEEPADPYGALPVPDEALPEAEAS